MVTSPFSFEAAAGWSKIAELPPNARIFLRSGGAFFGLAGGLGVPQLFTSGGRTHSLPELPSFLAYLKSPANHRLCLPFDRGKVTKVVCHDRKLAQVDEFSVRGVISAGTFFTDDDLWVIDSSGSPGGALVHLRRHASRWSVANRTAVPGCTTAGADCSQLEIHALGDRKRLVAIPVMGRLLQGSMVRANVLVIDTDTGKAAAVALPASKYPEELNEIMRPFAGRPLRGVYRSAVSSRGRIAIIPALPNDPREPILHDEVWWATVDDRNWKKARLPEQGVFVLFDNEELIVLTASGSVWTWRD